MFRQIKYFQGVVRNNSFSKAAEECHISQSAISQQIQALERELGFALLVRKNRKFELTPAGEHFYQKSLILTADYERICRESMKIANHDETVLRIGFLRGYVGTELHMAVEQFNKKYPDVIIQIEQGNHEELYYLEQQDTERDYYRDVIGFHGEYLFAENLEEARLMLIGGNAFMPIEGSTKTVNFDMPIARIPLYRGENQITRNYCAFWKTDNSGYYIEEFAEMLKLQFSRLE